MNKDTLLVLGASSDIGNEIIRRFADENVVILAHYNRSINKIRKLQNEISSTIIPIKADLSNEYEIVDFINFIEKNAVTPNKIIHLPAPKITNVRFKDIDWSDFRKNIDIQLKPAVLLLKHFIPIMAKKKEGKVLFVLSSCTFNIPPKFLSHYTTTKYALLGLMKSLASEYADKKININAISPSMVETGFLSEISKKIVEITADQSPFKRNATPKDISSLVKFLLSSESDYITGANIPISAGTAF